MWRAVRALREAIQQQEKSRKETPKESPGKNGSAPPLNAEQFDPEEGLDIKKTIISDGVDDLLLAGMGYHPLDAMVQGQCIRLLGVLAYGSDFVRILLPPFPSAWLSLLSCACIEPQVPRGERHNEETSANHGKFE